MNSYKASRTIKNEQKRLRLMSLLGQEITQRMLANAKKRLRGREDIAILDAGCGTGEDFAILQNAFPKAKITGVDTSQAALEKAKEKEIAFEVVEENLLSFKKAGFFDLVLIKSVLMHLPQVEKVLANLRGNLKSGGVVAVFEPDYTGMNCAFTEFESFKKHLAATMQGFGIDPYLGGKLAGYFKHSNFSQIDPLNVNLEIDPRDEGWEILLALCEVAGPSMAKFAPILTKARQTPQNVLEFKGRMAVVAQKP